MTSSLRGLSGQVYGDNYDPDLRGPLEIIVGLASALSVAERPVEPSDEPIDWPDEIQMSGLPWMLSGYNTKLVKSNRTFEECPEYVLAPYNMYYIIPIIGLRIAKSNGQWIARHYDPDVARYGEGYYVLAKRQHQSQDTPFGEWTDGGRVQRV